MSQCSDLGHVFIIEKSCGVICCNVCGKPITFDDIDLDTMLPKRPKSESDD